MRLIIRRRHPPTSRWGLVADSHDRIGWGIDHRCGAGRSSVPPWRTMDGLGEQSPRVPLGVSNRSCRRSFDPGGFTQMVILLLLTPTKIWPIAVPLCGTGVLFAPPLTWANTTVTKSLHLEAAIGGHFSPLLHMGDPLIEGRTFWFGPTMGLTHSVRPMGQAPEGLA